MEELYRYFATMGLLLILLGAILVLLPLLIKHAPMLEKLPPILVYVYRSGNFYFATSPILLIISAISILLFLLSRFMK